MNGGLPFVVRVISTGERTARVLVAGELDLATSPRLDKALTSALTDSSTLAPQPRRLFELAGMDGALPFIDE